MCYKIRGCIALLLFPQDKLTLGQASALAQMSQLEFQRLLANRQIPVHLDTLRKLGHKSIMTVGRISRNDVQVPFVTLTRGGKEPVVIKTMIDRLAEAKKFDLLTMAEVLGGLVFEEEAEREMFRRRFRMFQNVLRESWVYQEIGQEFREEERQKRLQGLREAIISFLQTRFPELLFFANQQTKSINDPEVLQILLTQLFAAQTAQEAWQMLLDINK